MNNEKHIKKKFKPKTFFDELAEYGFLEDYLKTFFSEKYKNDPKFKMEMFERLIKYADGEVPEIELYYLEKICESFGFFLEYTKQWRIPRH